MLNNSASRIQTDNNIEKNHSETLSTEKSFLMAASTFSSSSSFVGLIPSRPLVFIKSQEEDVSKGLINFLEPILKNENINVFIDEETVRGKDLKNLFKRIQDTRISLAIFSESKCDFNELRKIKEPVDEAIPIFYKVDAIGDLADLQNRCKKDLINSAVEEMSRLRTTSLECHIGENWVDIQAGVLVAPPRNAAAKMTFTMYQYVTSDRKSGLLVKGVAIRPMP
ncbi:uncharacterized protein PHLOEM PROTEIN 2-LIKE A7 isoform X2 [Arabidopsis lyrata subsp. lyrata]|uniref:uncharacterized protein PHLOEM PROTEIN 2-LIKE A7 isoform X2 n=2 Tax=Arabidopsis lyrata subsp. lyrata TaxID=81972 RepID=UPI000A29A887|nr:uncharacterized protein PHLOEM PROTEIN 2-LIKE A7 isoform X2 [Arabidopsis lyrata subsp. lyrata]|eukprot:XP_020874216.1 uncharacterized protein PHLOEM PROTEIN 2-LIKE A7 isoform X2 [Arabidopsis lyrata subsp. lyrata]